MKPKLQIILHELKHHSPFTFFATLFAVVLTAIAFSINQQGTITFSENFFEFLHPAHILFSAFVTTAIFYKHQKKITNAIIIGIIGAIVVGSLSDIIFPYLEGTFLNLNPSFHLPLIEEPIIILSVAIIGSILGLIFKKTELPHFMHIFISVFASLFYILAFSTITINPINLIIIFIITFIAVIVPCCTSDIIFPLLFLKKYKCKCCGE